MADIDIEESVSIKRIEAIGSLKSSFIFGVSNRLLIPAGAAALMLTFNVSWYFLGLFFAIFLLEVVLKYVVKLNITEIKQIFWRSLFGSKKKSVRN